MRGRSGTPAVTRALRKVAWPVLREHGFTSHSTRTIWRDRQDTIDVVYVQAMVGTAGSRALIGPASASFGSFAVAIGTYYTVRRLLPWEKPYVEPKDSSRPEEYWCHKRLQLPRPGGQPKSYPPTVWPVDEDGTNAEATVRDALRVIQAEALPWFDEQANLQRKYDDMSLLCFHRAKFEKVDAFFLNEDLMAGLAVRLGRVADAVRLFELLAARSFDPKARERYTTAVEAHERRIRRSKRFRDSPTPPAIPRLPYWHDGVMLRLEALRALRGVDG